MKQCVVCNKSFSVLKSLVTTNNLLTCEECAQDKIRKAEHDRKIERRRQQEAVKDAEHKREMERSQQQHKQAIEVRDHEQMLQVKERAQAEAEKATNHRQEIEKLQQEETERDLLRRHELQMEKVKTEGKTAEFEANARIAEAKAKEANSIARAEEAKAMSAKARAKEKEIELRGVLWKKYLDPNTNVQDKLLVMEEIKRLSIRDDQNAKKVPKEIKAPKSKQDPVGAHPHRPWTTSVLARVQ